MPKKTIIKRRKPGTGPSVNYFTEQTQEAVVLFKTAETPEEQKKIYTEKIFPAFKMLVENLIKVYGFQIQYESKEDLCLECIEFLYGVITKFDISKGKAFSYFNVVAKNWLTIKSKQNVKIVQSFMSLDNKEQFSAREMELIENYHFIQAPDEIITEEEITLENKKLIENIHNKLKSKNEEVCLDAIKILFQNVNELEIINKRAAMVYIRNITNMTPKQLSIVLSALKKYYKETKKEIKNGNQ